MKLMVTGYGRHGKDTFCELVGESFVSSSEIALESVIWPKMKNWYDSPEECFRDRINNRAEWARLITEYNTPDLTKLSRDIFKKSTIYCGIRNRDEFYSAKENGLFDLSIWIDASERLPEESQDSCTMTKDDCDVIITNNGTLEEFAQKVLRFRDSVMRKESIRSRIVNWADGVLPERTITMAIQKLVLEEIPEYLMNQKDPLELADIGILVYDIAHLAGVDLDSAIIQKLRINEARKWEVNPQTGLLKHVE